MKTKKSLEEKLKDVEAFMPGLKEKLSCYGGATWGIHWNGRVEDVEYTETDNYQVVAAKWDQHEWSEDGGGIQYEGWISIYYKDKGSKSEIKKQDTERIVTRDMSSASRDKTYLWPYHCVSIEPLGKATVRVAWADEEGKKGPMYQLDLKNSKPDKD